LFHCANIQPPPTPQEGESSTNSIAYSMIKRNSSSLKFDDQRTNVEIEEQSVCKCESSPSLLYQRSERGMRPSSKKKSPE